MTELPSKPSELIRLALKDLRLAETNPRYKVDMAVWHCPDSNDNTCRVCLAGAVIAGLGANPDEPISPYGFDPQTVQRLCALNRFRQGRVEHALNAMRIPTKPAVPIDRQVTPYDRSPSGFKRDMELLIEELERAGL